jgi:hypothetical protein
VSRGERRRIAGRADRIRHEEPLPATPVRM